jgi:hypothetical protein
VYIHVSGSNLTKSLAQKPFRRNGGLLRLHGLHAQGRLHLLRYDERQPGLLRLLLIDTARVFHQLGAPARKFLAGASSWCNKQKGAAPMVRDAFLLGFVWLQPVVLEARLSIYNRDRCQSHDRKGVVGAQ